MHKGLYCLCTRLVLLLLMAAAAPGHAAPAVQKVIEQARITRAADGRPVLAVRLGFVFAYQDHFPDGSGTELRIRIRPVLVPPVDRAALTRREGTRPPGASLACIDEVLYEGDAREGPWLTIRFTRTMHYRVIATPDRRSLKIFIEPPEKCTTEASP
ncbi:MAG TPA: hypothetical protein ENJ79_05215 [Gammaproteobacteria bacterium]|nr:hypothetical protein [Gammaproteobacteria bacterium]